MMIYKDKTNRGFAVGAFQDYYGHDCSIQKSSLATEDAIWFGVTDAQPKVMASDAKKLGVTTDETVGWIPFAIPKEVLLHTQMHLTREQVAEMIPILQQFVDTGEID
ncbi:MAG: hypothetical protein DRH57_06855 [Candidatus Cloacimonadota bacterium]|nr:MAG: hypothetical protein DRH57_06855 [Candidatus Cloacimonadota bacterium]